jgi:hypothetical protein
MTNETRDYSRDDLLALSAKRYLAKGYTDAQGKPIAESQTTFATGTAAQFSASWLAPPELALTYSTLKLKLMVMLKTRPTAPTPVIS